MSFCIGTDTAAREHIGTFILPERMNRMKLGILTWINEEDFALQAKRGLDFVEFDVNDRDREFISRLENTKRLSGQYGLPVQAIGRWNTMRITPEGINREELAAEFDLIDAAAELGCGIYIAGCNLVKEISYLQSCVYAVDYFEKLIEYGRTKGIKIAVYNCRMSNFVCEPAAWKLIHGHLKDLYIKYDAAHCLRFGGDPLRETIEWGDRFAHIHLKGCIVMNGKRYDDPPAGMDMINWPAMMAVLYSKGYDGGLSIELDSGCWEGELQDWAINRTIHYFRNLMI